MVRARDALGMPVPPAWVADLALRIRGAVGRLHARMVPGFNLILDRLFGLVDNKALFCAVDPFTTRPMGPAGVKEAKL